MSKHGPATVEAIPQPLEFALAPDRRRRLAPPRVMTGRERRWLYPSSGGFKRLERWIDRFVSQHVYPHLLGIWHPYSWQLPRRFGVAETALEPQNWPGNLNKLRILLLSDIHTGAFLKPEILLNITRALMELRPDIVAIAGDIVTGQSSDLDGFLPAFAPLTKAPLGAWYCHGNHDYFAGDAHRVREMLASVHIPTLTNTSVVLQHGVGQFILGGIDDRILGKPDWKSLVAANGTPHLLLAHNPDSFYEAAKCGIPLTLAGHTHGGQIRPASWGPIVRHSKFCLDEGSYAYQSSTLVVSRGLGSVGLPWRYGADPEAVLIEVSTPL